MRTATTAAVAVLASATPPRDGAPAAPVPCAHHSYSNGCSTGGRQGLSAARRCPDDHDGILSAVPALNRSRFIPAELWPQVVMVQDGAVEQRKLAAFRTAATAACDRVGDGVGEGVIGDPSRCSFDPRTLVGTSTGCGTITAQDDGDLSWAWRRHDRVQLHLPATPTTPYPWRRSTRWPDQR